MKNLLLAATILAGSGAAPAHDASDRAVDVNGFTAFDSSHWFAQCSSLTLDGVTVSSSLSQASARPSSRDRLPQHLTRCK